MLLPCQSGLRQWSADDIGVFGIEREQNSSTSIREMLLSVFVLTLVVVAAAPQAIFGFSVPTATTAKHRLSAIQLNGAVIELTDENFSKLISTTSSPLTLVDVYAPWCGPCKLMEPVLQELAKKYDADRQVLVCRYNVEGGGGGNNSVSKKSQSSFKTELALQGFLVRALPALVLLDTHGKVLKHWTGLSSEEIIHEGLRPHLATACGVSDATATRGRIHVGAWQQQNEDSYMLANPFA